MTTEASREMFSDELVEAMENLHMYPRLIAERAAKEAVAAYRTALRAKVGGMPTSYARSSDPDRHRDVLDRLAVLAAVLEIIEKP